MQPERFGVKLGIGPTMQNEVAVQYEYKRGEMIGQSNMVECCSSATRLLLAFDLPPLSMYRA